MVALHLILFAFTFATALASSPQGSGFPSFHLQVPSREEPPIGHSVVKPLENSAGNLHRDARDAWKKVQGVDPSKRQFAKTQEQTHDNIANDHDNNYRLHKYYSDLTHLTTKPWTDAQLVDAIAKAKDSAKRANASLSEANTILGNHKAR